MLEQIRALFSGDAKKPAVAKPADLQIAVGALLVEAALRNDEFDPAERTTIERLLAARFHLSAAAAHALVKECEGIIADSHQLFGFIRQVMKEMSEEARIKLIEMLWEVAYADGALDLHEDALIRKVAGLIYVTDFDRGAARRRVREKLGLGA